MNERLVDCPVCGRRMEFSAAEQKYFCRCGYRFVLDAGLPRWDQPPSTHEELVRRKQVIKHFKLHF